MARLSIQACRGLRGTIRVPGDKSISHRAVMFGALAQGKSVIEGFLPAEDCLRTVAAMEAMGVVVERRGETALFIQGCGSSGLQEPHSVLDLGNSGTGLRLLLGIVAGAGLFAVLTGDDSLRRRPMGRVAEPLRLMGAEIWGRGDGNFAPLAVQKARLHGIEYLLPVASAQVKSSLLLAGLLADGITSIVEPQLTRDHTERMLRVFGVRFEREGTKIRVWGGGRLEGQRVVVPGDFSSAAFFMVAGSIVPGSEIWIRDVGVNPTRDGILDALWEMGADISVENRRELTGEPVADLRVRSASLKGITLPVNWIPRTIDELPILCVAAACATGETVIRGAGELRFKESDRIATMAGELKRLGVEVEEHPDGLRVSGRAFLKGGLLKSHGDHRVAMSLLVAGLACEGETVVEEAECIDTSFPGFMSLLSSLMVH